MDNTNKGNKTKQCTIPSVINWVAVTYKLPEEVRAVLVYSECCEVCWHMNIAEIEEGKWFESGSGEDLKLQPTHWAELPEPPCL
tara:strand:+ start:90 stop:341 length:252 start_codon:yes stop_codon:yes gene_type:complete